MRIVPIVSIALAFSVVSLGEVAAQQPTSASQRGPEVEDVRLEGVRQLDERLVRSVLVTRESRCRSPLLALPCAVGIGERAAYFDAFEVRRDGARIDSLYAAWGYPDAAVISETVALGDGDVAVVFRVAEGAPLRVRSVTVRGLEAVPGGVEVGELPLRAGQPYAEPLLAASQQQIADALAERGYAFARVDVAGEPAPGANAVDVALEVTPGPSAVFGAAEVRAQRPLREETVRERLAFRPGDPFRPDALRRTAERLYDLPIVEEVRIAPAPVVAGDSTVPVTVTVTRGRLGAWSGDVYVSSSTCLGGTVAVAHRHLGRKPRVVSLQAGLSNVGGGEVCGRDETDAFTEPAYLLRGSLREPLAARTWLLLDGELIREAATRAYVRRGARGRLGLAAPLGRAWQGEIGYALERTDDEAGGPFFCAVYGACAGEALDARVGATTLAPVEVALTFAPPWARRTRLAPVPAESAAALPPEPRWTYGARASLSTAAAATGSEVGFARALVEGSAARRLGRSAEIASRLRLGVLAEGDEPVPPQVRLYGGGPLGVRGVAPYLLGPRLLVVRDDAADDLGCPITPGGCEGAEVDPDDVRLRAVGGNALVETSVEGRLWIARWLQLAAFVDAGAVWGGVDDAPTSIASADVLVTPGVGALVISPVGPVRVDVAYDPSPARRLPLLAPAPDGDGFVSLGEVVFDPVRFGDPDPWECFRRRLRLQISLGQPF